jgi:hypothetical protein
MYWASAAGAQPGLMIRPFGDLDAGRHLATVIVVHDSGRLHPEAIIFTTTAS